MVFMEISGWKKWDAVIFKIIYPELIYETIYNNRGNRLYYLWFIRATEGLAAFGFNKRFGIRSKCAKDLYSTIERKKSKQVIVAVIDSR